MLHIRHRSVCSLQYLECFLTLEFRRPIRQMLFQTFTRERYDDVALIFQGRD
jgi:hypothetical protein